MGWFSKQKRRIRDVRHVDDAVVMHLKQFLASRRGVEAWVEEPTSFNPASLLLVAYDGEWTRRPVPSVEWAGEFCKRADLPCYLAGVVSYPQRMRDFDRRKKEQSE